MSREEIFEVYCAVKKYLERSDIRYKKTNFLLPVMEKNLEENTVAVKDFQKYIIDEYLQSKKEWASGLCAMYIYDEKTKKIVKDLCCDDVVQMVLNYSCKWL